MGDQGVAVNTEPLLAVTLDIVVARAFQPPRLRRTWPKASAISWRATSAGAIDELTIRVDGQPVAVHAGGSRA